MKRQYLLISKKFGNSNLQSWHPTKQLKLSKASRVNRDYTIISQFAHFQQFINFQLYSSLQPLLLIRKKDVNIDKIANLENKQKIIQMAKIQELSHDTLGIVFSYLKIHEIMQFSATCTNFQNHCSIKTVKKLENNIVENQQNANILYMQSPLSKMIEFQKKTYELQLLRFTAKTKDQGWVKDCQSGSWIEAQFTQNKNTEQLQFRQRQTQNQRREPLIYNYEVREFQRKSKILCKHSIPLSSTNVNVYLRSSGDGWEISCQEMEIMGIYSQGIALTAKQLQMFTLKKKLCQKVVTRGQRFRRVKHRMQ